MKPNHQPTTEVQNQLELEIHGMTCESCATHVVQALKELKGVEEAHIPGWQSGRATVTVDS
jgi:copper chaperone CopZ